MNIARNNNMPAISSSTEPLEPLVSIGSFSVATCWRLSEGDEVLPAHSKVIRPLLAAAAAAFVWPPSKEARLLAYPGEILIPERGRYQFDLSRDVLTGYEGFWNASGWRRGSIVLRLAQPPMNVAELFMHCSGPFVYTTRRQITKGDSQAALRYCDDYVLQGELAFCFSASNGIEHLSVFAPQAMLQELYHIASDYCRPFKRWFECSPGEAVNLIPSGDV